MNSTSGTGDPADGLEGLRAAVAEGNTDLYRHVALYLQVLRAVLPQRVEQACFQLATQVHVQRYLGLPISRRRELHRLLRERVSRCSSLLTVEQLVVLARRLEQENRQQQQRRQRQLLQRLLQQGGKGAQPEAEATRQGGRHADPSEQDATPLPPGSVQLDLATPLEAASLHWDLGLAATGGAEAHDPQDAGSDDQDDAAESQEAPASGSSQPEGEEAELMAALIEGLIEAGAFDQGDADEEADNDGDSGVAAGLGAAMERGSAAMAMPRQLGPLSGTGSAPLPASDDMPEPPGLLLEAGPELNAENGGPGDSPWDQPGLPQDPLLLLRWLDGIEAALARRLRNLSHAINVDLLRLGLSRGLLPVSLLEAVLQGQIETMASPANVLRLQLPFGLRPGAPPLQAMAILLRPVDLEMEEPRLRTCRRRIHQHRQQVRKMAQTYRRLQRRLQAHEAERLWLQDIRASRTAEP